MDPEEQEQTLKVCNEALGYCEVPTRVESISSESKRTVEVVCYKYYDSARREMLRKQAPSFAKRTEGLVTVDYNHPKWPVSYLYPSDAMFIQVVLDQQGREIPRSEYDTESLPDSPSDDWPSGSLGIFARDHGHMATRVMDLRKGFDPLFSYVLSLSLAKKLCLPLDAAPGVLDRISFELSRAMGDAQAQDSAESQRREPDASWIEERS